MSTLDPVSYTHLGALASHYAPRTPCYRIPAGLAEAPFPGRRTGLLAQRPANWPVAKFWPMPSQSEDYARALYAALHEACLLYTSRCV